MKLKGCGAKAGPPATLSKKKPTSTGAGIEGSLHLSSPFIQGCYLSAWHTRFTATCTCQWCRCEIKLREMLFFFFSPLLTNLPLPQDIPLLWCTAGSCSISRPQFCICSTPSLDWRSPSSTSVRSRSVSGVFSSF